MRFFKNKKKLLLYLLVISFLLLAGKVILFAIASKSQEKEIPISENSLGKENVSSEGITDLPSDFPVYQDSELITFAESEDGQGMSYAWEAEKDPILIFEYFKSELRFGGWVLDSESLIGDSSVVSFEKGNVSGFLGVFRGSSGKTVISVTIRKP